MIANVFFVSGSSMEFTEADGQCDDEPSTSMFGSTCCIVCSHFMLD